MDARQKRRGSSSSMKSYRSKDDPPHFSTEERNSPCAETEGMDANCEKRPKSSTCLSVKTNRSRTPPPYFGLENPDGRSVNPVETQFAGTGAQAKTTDGPIFPPLMEDWTKEHVKDWLINTLKVPQKTAQNLYDQELSGACLVSFEKQDLLELGVPPAPAIQIMRQVQKFRRNSETSEPSVRIPTRHYEPCESEEWKHSEMHNVPGNLGEYVEIETVSSDSGIQSGSSTLHMLQTARNKIRSLIGERTDGPQLHLEITDNPTFLQLEMPRCQIRPFDKSNSTIFYTQNYLLPPMAGPSNLINPVHEYQLLPCVNEASEREILHEFTKEVFTFAASCMNSRTNGTIHFGVKSQPGQGGHGQVVGHKITSFSKYNESFESCLSEYFEEQQVNAARLCIRPPTFIQVHRQDGTTSDKWVIEVDVVPTYSETQQDIFYTKLSVASTEQKQKCKTECLFVRDGPRSINVLAETNPRIVQENLRSLTDKVKGWTSARKTAEEKDEKRPSQGNQGQRLKQLITRGRDAFENSLHIIVVTDKCHPSQVEHLDFLTEMKLFAVLDFDPESDVNGTCSFYRRDRIGNLHYPQMYTTQDSVTATIQKLNLFKQTSWVFCNGRVKEESETEKPLTPSEWLKKRSGDISNLVSFLCKPDLVSKDRLLVIFMLHSAVTDISSPILETFCAIYRTLEGVDNILCICKDSSVFSHWRNLIEHRCKEDITSKCIYELSLIEISSTVKKLLEPQTQSSRRFLPSTGSSSVLLARKDEELMTDLCILCENECENTEIESKHSFEEFKTKTEEDFYRGGQVSWWNFYISEKKDSLPFIKRDKYSEVYDLITPVEGHTSPCVIINLFHHPGCGGTTLAMHVLWNLRSKFRCAVAKNNTATNNDIATQVINLLTYGKQEQSGYKPVLLLLDNWDDVEGLKQSILNVASGRQLHNNLLVIILNCERTGFPEESSRESRTANVFITNKLSPKEQALFSDKFQQLKDEHKKPETFYAFMIMTNNFSESYITNLVSNIVKDLDATTQQGRLFSFLALLNTHVNGSYLSLSLCEDLMGIRYALFKTETLDDKMYPYSTLMITFTAEEHGSYQAVRFLHQMIARKCLEFLTQKHNLSLPEITLNLLHCDTLYKSGMGKDFLLKNIQSMLVTRHRKKQGDDKDTLFSPLIEDIHKEQSDQVKDIFERAILRFDKSATLPQALARYFCLKEGEFQSALKWALDAQRKKSNSYIADTVGQVYKSHLKKESEDPDSLTPETLDKCLKLASSAVTAFQESQELAKKDDSFDSFDIQHKKRHTSYNTSGYVGETEVIMTLLDIIEQLPVAAASDRHKRDTILQFLKGHQPVSRLYDNNATINQFVAVLENHERFLVSLMPRLKDIFGFFENYYTYLKPRSQITETGDERNKLKVSEFFKKYLKVFCSLEEEKTTEKANKPNLSLRQQIVDHRQYLEMKKADSFAGLLLHLNDKRHLEAEHILKKWQAIVDSSSRVNVSDMVNFILANIVLHSLKPSSKELKKYEELVSLLNEALQKEGTHSNLTEMYYLSMLLLWPTQGQKLDSTAAYRNISMYVTSAKKSFHRRFSHMFPARSAIAHFFLGKSSGLKRIISKVRLDQILIDVSKQQATCSGQSSQPRNLHQLWQSGAAWNEPEIQQKLLRIKGMSEHGDIYVNYGGSLKILVRPAYLGDIRSGYSREEVSFYLGFTMEGPVAYNVRYENQQ